LEASPNIILGDVLDHEVEGAVPPLTKKLDGLPEKERERIMRIFEFMIDMVRDEMANAEKDKNSETVE